MKRPVLTREENKHRISGEGTKAAKARAAKSRAAIEKAMREIEADVEKNGGIYPFAKGRVSRKEVLRKAGKSPSYLNKSDAHIVELRDDVDAFVDRTAKRFLQGAKSIRRAVHERTEAARDETAMIRQAWHEAELEFNETRAELDEARRRIEQLQAENTALTKKLSGNTVIDLNPRRK